MLSRILVPMDDSEMAARALRYAFEAHPDAEITVLHVVGEPSPMLGEATGLALADDLEDAKEAHADSVFERARDIADEHGADIETIVEMGHPGRAIVRRAPDFDTVVIGTHGDSLSDRIFIGNVAKTVFRRSPVPVTVVR